MEKSQTFNQIPMTISLLKQVIARGPPFRIDDQLLDLVEIIGLVTEQKELSSFIELTLTDSSGSISVSTYRTDIHEKPTPMQGYEFKLNSYALIIGELVNKNDNIVINLVHIRNIDRLSELNLFKTKILWNYINRQNRLGNNISMNLALTGESNPAREKNQNSVKFRDIIGLAKDSLSESQIGKIVSDLADHGFSYIPESDLYIIT